MATLLNRTDKVYCFPWCRLHRSWCMLYIQYHQPPSDSSGHRRINTVLKGPKGRVLVNKIYVCQSRSTTGCERDKIWVTDSIPVLLSLEVRTPRDNHAKFDVHGRRNRYQGHGSLCMPDVIVTKMLMLCGRNALPDL